MSIEGLVTLLIYLVIIGLILYVVWWGISQVPMIEPIATVVKTGFVLIVCLVAIAFLIQLLPGTPIRLFGR